MYLDLKNEIKCPTSLGVIKIPEVKISLQNNILKIAKIPFRAAPWKFDDYYLGFNDESLEKLKVFMQKYYDLEFTNQIYTQLKTNLSQYIEHYPLFVHETRFFNYLFEHTISDHKTHCKYDNLWTLKIIQKIENVLKTFIKKSNKNVVKPNDVKLK